MKYIQPQFNSLLHRLCALLPIVKKPRSVPVVVLPPVRWQQLELDFRREPKGNTPSEVERQPLVRATPLRQGDLERSA